MHKLHTLKDKLCKEIKEYADRSAFSPNDIETIRNLISSINKINEYMGAEEEKEGFSNRMSRAYRGAAYDYDGHDSAYRRDAMGRYSRNEDMVGKLYEVMNEAPEHMKHEIKQMVDKLERM